MDAATEDGDLLTESDVLEGELDLRSCESSEKVNHLLVIDLCASSRLAAAAKAASSTAAR